MRFLTIVFLGLSLWQQSNPNSSVTKSGVEKRDTQRQKEQPQKTESKTSIPAISSDGHPQQSPVAQCAQKDTYNPTSDRLYRAYLWFTIIGVVGGIVGILILICQSIMLRSSVNAAHKSADALMASEAAFLDVPVQTVTLVRGDPGKHFVSFRIKNIGRTVAFIFAGESLLQLSDDARQPPVPALYEWAANLRAEFLLPDKIESPSLAFLSVAGEPAPGTTEEPFVGKVLSGEQYAQIEQRSLTLWFYGFMRYRDIFQRKYEVRYCHRFEPKLSPTPGFIVDGPPEFNRLTRYGETTER